MFGCLYSLSYLIITLVLINKYLKFVLTDKHIQFLNGKGLPTLPIFWISVFLFSCESGKNPDDWDIYGGSRERIQYSALDQIDTGNVQNLQVAWTYHTKDGGETGQIQANPLIVDGILYGVSPKLKLFAVHADTGEEIWQFDPSEIMMKDEAGRRSYGINACRGVALHREENNEHLIFYTVGSSLICINSKTGQPVESFGNEGRVLLHDGLEFERDVHNLRVTATSPGIIYKDLIIMGSSLSEVEESAPGHIRAYNIYSGEIEWMFRTIPQPGEVGYDSWEDPEAYKFVGGANAWGGLVLDEKRGVVYTATGSAVPDFYGGRRLGDNLFANSILALDAASGRYLWHFQGVHHDLWDYDFPTSPTLVTVRKDGKVIDALVQVSKQGFIYMLDRETGEPVYPIVEKPFPASDLQGEQASPTQPVPTVIPPFVRQEFNESDLNNLIPDSSFQELRERFLSYRSGGMYIPPGIQPTVVLPGYTGGAEWGGPSFDPHTGLLYINATEMPWVVSMSDAKDVAAPVSRQSYLEAGKSIYSRSCKSCHGAELEGTGNIPPLKNLGGTISENEFHEILDLGRRMMPPFAYLSDEEKSALASFLLDLKDIQSQRFIHKERVSHPFYESPYIFGGFKQFLTLEGYPAIAPPWGTLTAIDLNAGNVVWKNPLGDYPEFKEKGIHTGTENWGGPVTTAGGLVFIGATRDEKFRAFNKYTGELLFETSLPAGGYATPSVYSVNEKQYVVIACGGGRMNTKSGDAYVAFSLPDKKPYHIK